MAANDFLDVFDLSAPPAFIRHRYTPSEHRKLDITGLKRFLLNFCDEFSLLSSSKNTDLRKEIYIVDKLLHKMNGPFRRHAHFQKAKRVRKLWRRLDAEEGDLKIVSEFANSIQLDKNDDLYCPSGESFRYLLLKIRKTAKILAEIYFLCIECCRWILSMLDLGHFVQVHCLLLGALARFRAESCGRLKLLNEFYEKFSTGNYLKNGLLLKGLETKEDFRGKFLEFFELPKVKMALDQDRLVQSENWHSEHRLNVVDYFEKLFNVRLVAQKAKKENTSLAHLKDRKTPMQQMAFGQALKRKEVQNENSSSSILPVEEFHDLGIPIERTKIKISKKGKAEKIIRKKIDEATSVGDLKKVLRRLEKVKKEKGYVLKATLFLKEKLAMKKKNKTINVKKISEKLTTFF